MRITLFDCLDSFTWNLVHDLERAGARVRVVEEGQWQPSDWTQTDALVLSPARDCRKNIPSCWTC